MSLPTYFVARSTEPALLPTDAATAVYAVDNFFTVQGERQIEWAVVIDGTGRLHAVQIGQRSALPSEIQSQLAYNEVARASSARVLDLAEFYVFELDVAEQPADEPGANDPVYLYGTLSGPYRPDSAEPAAVPAALEGQLTLTRADLLEGVVRGVNHGFRYPSTAGASGTVSGCFHLMLPVDREDRLQRGHGIALAYPLMPAELLTANPANEIMVNQLVFDMLTAMKNDLTKAGETSPLRTQLLPVPSRVLLEQELVKQGFRIEGNTAVKTPQATGVVGEVLIAVFGEYMKKRVEIPPEGTIRQFAEIAQKTLAAMPNWPSNRSRLLQARTRAGWAPALPVPKVEIPSVVPAPPPPRRPQPSSNPPVPPPAETKAPPSRPRIYRPPNKTRDWMNDFVDAHRKPGRPAPKLTRMDTIEKPRKSEGKARPDWMNDFE